MRNQHCGAMARYYFDVEDGSRVAVDQEGEDHPSLESAKREAAHVAAVLGRDRLRGEGTLRVMVRNERNERCLTVTLSLRIDV